MYSVSVFAASEIGVVGFFQGVTWGQIIAAAIVATLLSVVTTLLIEYAAKPRLELRKLRKIRDSTQVEEITFSLKEIRAGLILVTEFSGFSTNGSIIPTKKHMLSQQLLHISTAAENVQKNLARLTKKYELNSSDMQIVLTTAADIEASSMRCRNNVDQNKSKAFRDQNQKTLKKYIPRVDEALRLFGGKR